METAALTDDELRPADNVIAFLERCGDGDIESGVGHILGLGTSTDIRKFREGIYRAINQKE